MANIYQLNQSQPPPGLQSKLDTNDQVTNLDDKIKALFHSENTNSSP